MSDPQAPAAFADGVCLPGAACIALCEALPRAADLDSAMHIVEGVRHDLLGDGLLTVNMRIAPAAEIPNDQVVLQRAWSSDPLAYPPGGRKHKIMTEWSRQLLQNGQVYVGEGDVDLAQAFDDHALITSLGLHCVVNVPLLDKNRNCFATFNVLGRRTFWRDDEVLLVRLLATLAAPAIQRAVRHASKAVSATARLSEVHAPTPN